MFQLWMTLFIIQFFQGRGYCLDVLDKQENASEAEQMSLDQMRRPQAPGADLDTDIDGGRWRRHIGSIAAFGGFPTTGNKNKINRPLSSTLISRGDLLVSEPMWKMNRDSELGGISKEKRYPDGTDEFSLSGRRDVDMIPPPRILLPQSTTYKPHNVAIPIQNEARNRVLNRLLRLLMAVQTNPDLQSKSKKFLGSLARSNGLPQSSSPARVVPSFLYKGSTAIPLPGKRTSLGEPSVNWADLFDDFDGLASDDDQWVDYYDPDTSDNVIDDSVEQGQMLEPVKRHISSAMKSGWNRRLGASRN